MPRTYVMNWQADKCRWRKMYRGKQYFVTCRELDCLPTKEDSWQAANLWWQETLRNVSASAILERQDPAELLALANKGEAARSMLHLLTNGETAKESPTLVSPRLPTTDQGQASLAINLDRRIRRGQEGRSIGQYFEDWKCLQQARNDSGEVGASRTGMNFICLKKFVDWLGKDSAPLIDEAKWSAWYTHLLRLDHATSHKKRIWQVSKRFLEYLSQHRVIDVPRNINSKDFSFKIIPHDIATLTVQEVRSLLDAATIGQTKLHLLLMLNCGMTAVDISALRQEEVDWKTGTITRKRSKTKTEANVPEVTYKLWTETFKLLKQHRSQGESVLTTKTGGPWVSEVMEGGQLKRTDNVASCFKYIQAKQTVRASPKMFRATAATLLATHPQYKFYSQYFLGQSPRTIADKHYVKPSEAEFFDALAWLGKSILG